MGDAPRAWEYRGEPTWVEGVPFGRDVQPGDHYVSVEPMTPADVDLAAQAHAEAAIAATWQRALRMHLEASVEAGGVGDAMEAAFEAASDAPLDGEGDRRMATEPAGGTFAALLDRHFPQTGPCGMCGTPGVLARHRELDTVVERVWAGEPMPDVADDYGHPVDVIERVVAEWVHGGEHDPGRVGRGDA